MLLEHKKNFAMNNEQVADWKTCIENRIMNMNFIMNQQTRKPTKPKWFLNLPFIEVVVHDSKHSLPAATEAPVPEAAVTSTALTALIDVNKQVFKDGYAFGFHWDILLAWRCPENHIIEKNKELSMPLLTEELEAADETNLVKWTWSDGHSIVFDFCTVGALKLKQRQNIAKLGAPCAWEGEHVVTHNRISVSQRVDRNLLLSIYEQNKQVGMLKMSHFGEIQNEHQQIEPTHPVAIAAYKFFIPIAKAYAENTITREQITIKRDEGLRNLGILNGSRRGPRVKAAPTEQPVTASPAAHEVDSIEAKAPAAAQPAPPATKRSAPKGGEESRVPKKPKAVAKPRVSAKEVLKTNAPQPAVAFSSVPMSASEMINAWNDLASEPA
jgi:hypothetical protein